MLIRKICVHWTRYASFALFVMCLMCSTVLAQHNPDTTEIQRRVLNLVHERLGIWGTVDNRGVILGLTGDGLNAGLTSQDPVERGYQFFERNADLFQMVNPRNELVARRRGNSARRSGSVSFGQIVNGIPVGGSSYLLHFMPDSANFIRFDLLSGGFMPEARLINTIPAISQAYAESLGLNDPEHGSQLNRVFIGAPSKLIIGKIDGSLRLLWKINIDNGRYGNANYWIDAQTGAVLKVESGIHNDFLR